MSYPKIKRLQRMSISKNNLHNAQPQAALTEEAHSRVAVWGLPLAALVIAVAALVLAWFQGERLGVPDGTPRTLALIGIPVLLVVIVIIHLIAISTGAYVGAAKLFRLQTGEKEAASTTGQQIKRDARLQRLFEELRVSQGRRWRYRSPWLMVSGADTLVDQVAPGLKRAGVMPVGNAILVHGAPDGIDAGVWRRQIHKLRSRRPVDGLVHVTHVDERDIELPRVLAALAADIGWDAPVTLLHAVPAQGDRPETFEVIGAFPRAAYKGGPPALDLRDQLAAIERGTADAGVQQCTAPTRVSYLAEISQYIGTRLEHIVTGWQALHASQWLRAPLAGVMFVPIFEATAAMPMPVPIAADASTRVTNIPITFPPQPAALLPARCAIATRRRMGRRGVC